MKVTLDANCMYELESASCSPALRRLVEMSNAGSITLQIPEIIASEQQKGGGHLDNFGTFETRAAQAGLVNATFLSPLAYIGMAYIGHARIGGGESEEQERRIHDILFPHTPFDANDTGPVDSSVRDHWRNAKCDVQAMWCHIDSGGDVFVTRDQGFLKQSRRSKLEKLGAGRVASPEEALAYIEAADAAKPV